VTPLGFKLASGVHPAYELMRTGKFEVEETQIIASLLPKSDVFIDVGANLGYYSLLALHIGKTVIAFEPQQQNIQCLCLNLDINGWKNKAEVFPIALSDRSGLMTLYGASGPSASLIKNWAGYSSRFKKMVPVSKLDNILAGRFVGERLFIKIDVEGAEYSVLKGAMKTLNRGPKPVWLIEICLQEFHPNGKNPDFENIFRLFWDNGYNAFTANANVHLVTPADVTKWFAEGFSGSKTFNYIFAESKNIMAS
jgi:FkbM family methyltransferase